MQQIRGFRVVHVFDISQTEGEELPDLDAVRPKLLDADAPEGIWDALVAQADGAGFEVIRNQRGSENGYCDFSSKQIAVRPDVAPAQAVKTLIHELGHALLHGEELPRSKEVAEVEVESVAYIVCDAIGLDSGDYSFAYVARWADGVDRAHQGDRRAGHRLRQDHPLAARVRGGRVLRNCLSHGQAIRQHLGDDDRRRTRRNPRYDDRRPGRRSVGSG